MTKDRIWLPTIIIISLVFAGLLTLRGEILAVSLPLVIFIFVGFINAPRQLDIEIKRYVAPTNVQQGDSIQIRLLIENHGAVLQKLVLTDKTPPGLEISEGRTNWLLTLKPGEQTEFSYQVRGKRGKYCFQDIDVSASDPFGLFLTLVSPK